MRRRAASIVGKIRIYALAPPDLFDQALNAEKFLSYVRGPQATSVLRRKRQHRGGIVEAVFKNA